MPRIIIIIIYYYYDYEYYCCAISELCEGSYLKRGFQSPMHNVRIILLVICQVPHYSYEHRLLLLLLWLLHSRCAGRIVWPYIECIYILSRYRFNRELHFKIFEHRTTFRGDSLKFDKLQVIKPRRPHSVCSILLKMNI